MSQIFEKYWYQDEPAVARAFLFNLRDDDLRAGGSVHEGDIVVGQCGFVAAETDVIGFRGTTISYSPNRCVEWQNHYLTCMALDDLPAGSTLRSKSSKLRHKHYVVAELSWVRLGAHARKIGLPVVHSDSGRLLVNLEIFTVPSRTPAYRRAKLL